jgi:predicted DNA-binding WGR domain protein
MVSIGNMGAARTILESLMTDKQKKQTGKPELSETNRQIISGLESAGYVVDERIGQSSFKCTLGVKKKLEDTYYSLGILVDDDFHYKNEDLVEQYYQRPSILGAFGWQIATVFAKDWLEDSHRVFDSLLKLLEGKVEQEGNLHQSTTNGTTGNEAKNEDELLYTRLQTSDEARFWEIAQKDNQLFIRFGKTGTKGQVQVKTFGSDSQAQIIKEELIKEQGKMGYVN